MHTTIRRYEGISSNTIEDIIERIEEGFVPIISASPGFIGYKLIDAGDGVMVTISVFETEVAAKESNKAAASWVKENLSALLSKPPQITVGEVRVDKKA